MKFTEGCAAKIEVPAGQKEAVVFEDGTPGFGIRKFEDGRAVYFVRYTVAGVRRKLVLSPCSPGVLKSMRQRAAEIRADAKRGQDPLAEKQTVIKEQKAAKQAERQAREHSLAVLVEQYLPGKREEMKPRSFQQVERHLRKQWAALHDRPVASLTRADLVKVIDELARNSGKTAADRAKASMSAFMAWCLERQIIHASPIAGISRRATSGPRERVLTEDELVAIWKATDEDGDYNALVRLLMLTGQRREEFGGLAWDEVDLDKREIRLPGERTKNGRAHTIPLSDAAMAILQSIPRRGNRRLVFGRGEGGFSGWSKCKERLDARLGKAVEPWTIHDLRRTLATLSADHDFAAPHIIEAMLNHQSGSKAGIVGVYNRASHERGKRQLADRYGEHIMALVEGRQSNVVPLVKAVG
jgi:integrase